MPLFCGKKYPSVYLSVSDFIFFISALLSYDLLSRQTVNRLDAVVISTK